MCDVSSVCDANCCCDPDCTTEPTHAFSKCVQSAFASSLYLRCVDVEKGPLEAIRINNQEYTTTSVFAATAICVMTSNLPSSMSIYHQFPSPATATAVAAFPESNTWPAPTAVRISNGSSSSSLVVDDMLPVLYASLNSQGSVYSLEVSSRGGYWATPTPDGNGACTRDKSARFLRDEAVSCHSVGALQDLCDTGAQTGTNWLASQRLNFALFAPYGYSLRDTSHLIPLTIVFVDAATGATMDIVKTNDLFSAILGSASLSVPSFSAPKTVIQSSYVAATSDSAAMCKNAVVGQRLLLEYAMSPQPALVNATIVLSIQRQLLESPTGRYAFSASTVYYRQGTQPPGTNAPQKVGRPGYLQGASILAGAKVTSTDGTRTAVQPLAEGFQLPTGRCGAGKFLKVKFLRNVMTASCEVTLTEASLQSTCASATGSLDALTQALTIPGSGMTVPNVFGFSGDANMQNINHWTPVAGLPLPTPPQAQYDAVSRKCNNLVVGLRWVVAVARAGPVYNPQDVIAGVKVEPIIGTWRFVNKTHPPTVSAGSTSRAFFDFTVNFVRVDGAGGVMQLPIVPPSILPEIEPDVFYPFRLPSASTGTDNTPS
jgi:hypothetical protein